MKDFFTFLTLQAVGYSILSYHFRVLAQGKVKATLFSEAAYSSFSFWIVRSVAHNENSIPAWLGFVVGSVIGTSIGMYMTRHRPKGEEGNECKI